MSGRSGSCISRRSVPLGLYRRGPLVKTLQHNSAVGSLSWNLVSDWSQALAFGVYIYVVEDPRGNRHIGKFALIK